MNLFAKKSYELSLIKRKIEDVTHPKLVDICKLFANTQIPIFMAFDTQGAFWSWFLHYPFALPF